MSIDGVTTCLWFDGQAEDAVQFYVATFPGSTIVSTSYYPTDAQRPEGSVLTVEFELFGRPFLALNGGPQYAHSHAISFQVFCDTQEEVDRLWDALVSNGGEESMCGWCSDRFGVSWRSSRGGFLSCSQVQMLKWLVSRRSACSPCARS